MRWCSRRSGAATRKSCAELCDDDVYQSFAAAIDAREAAGETLDNRLVRIEDTVVHSARPRRPHRAHRRALPAPTSPPSPATRTAHVVAGSLDDAVESHDIWTFSRDVNAPRARLAARRNRRRLIARASGRAQLGRARRRLPCSAAACALVPPVESARPAPARRPAARPRSRLRRPTPAPTALLDRRPAGPVGGIARPGPARRRRGARLVRRKLPAAAAPHRRQRADPRRRTGRRLRRRPLGWPRQDAGALLRRLSSRPRVVGDGAAFVTGYYEPEIAGSAHPAPGLRGAGLRHAVRPRARLAGRNAAPGAHRPPPLGRVDLNGRYVPYYDRTEIENGALAGRGLEIAWAADPIELFFLQIQGSGRLLTPEGEGDPHRLRRPERPRLRRYRLADARARAASATGRGSTRARCRASCASLREHPDEGRAMMRQNLSWVFFRELTGDGPLGALEVPVRSGSSVAADPAYTPLGAPVFLDYRPPRRSTACGSRRTPAARSRAPTASTASGARASRRARSPAA